MGEEGDNKNEKGKDKLLRWASSLPEGSYFFVCLFFCFFGGGKGGGEGRVVPLVKHLSIASPNPKLPKIVEILWSNSGANTLILH